MSLTRDSGKWHNTLKAFPGEKGNADFASVSENIQIMEAGKDNRKDREITLLVMRDVMDEPVQYRVKVRTIKMALFSIVGLPLLLLMTLVTAGAKCAVTENRYAAMESVYGKVAGRYCVSSSKLMELRERLESVELEFQSSKKRARSVISDVETDLKRWSPADNPNGMGGPLDLINGDKEGEGLEDDSLPLSTSQIEQVQDLEQRLALLDARLKSYDKAIEELEKVREEKVSLFGALPSIWPVEGRISSPFGPRVHPISGVMKMHTGIDIAAERGTKIYAPAPGVVTFSDRKGGYGNALIIDHGYGVSTLYGHCQTLLVSAGHTVKKGQVIALVGSTGYSTGPHLHFETRLNDIPVDPMQYLSVYSPGPEDEDQCQYARNQ